MQPKLAPDIKNLMDWLYTQWKPTDPITVQNITSEPYDFKYCTGEEIETPDQFTKKVISREYDERTIQPGETLNLLGAAAYVFVDGVARSYAYEQALSSQDPATPAPQRRLATVRALRNLKALIEIAQKVIVGKADVIMAQRKGGTPLKASTSVPTTTQPTSLLDAQGDGTEPKFDKIVNANGSVRYVKDGKTISKVEYEAGIGNAGREA